MEGFRAITIMGLLDGSQNAMKWETSDTIATVAAIVAVVSLLISLYQYWNLRHESRIKALQGDKESVGYEAYRLSQGQLPRSKKRRNELINSLCLAAVFEASGRSRTMVYRALSRILDEYPEEVIATILEIEKNFNDYEHLTDLSRGRERLTSLRNALRLDPNVKETDKTGEAANRRSEAR